MARSEIGQLRHWIKIQTRDADETSTTDSTVTYSDVAPAQRAAVENRTGQQFVKDRGSDRENTHKIKLRYIPALSQSNYILVLNGPFAGQRFKFDSVQADSLGRMVVVRCYAIGTTSAFVQPSAGSLPDIF